MGEVAKTPESQITKFDDFSSVEQMIGFAETLIKGKLLPTAYKTPESVVTAITQGKELGFKALTAINNIHIIENKATLSVHAIMALLKKADIRYEIVKDYEPVYKKDKEGNEKKIDVVTSIRFLEKWNDRIIENVVSFSMKEAASQGLTEKSNWVKMPKIMLRNRCLAIGARLVAPDALMGLYETSEAAEFTNTNHSVKDDGSVIVDTIVVE